MNNSFFGMRSIALLCLGASLAFGQASIVPEQSLPGLATLLDEALSNSPRMIMRNAEAAAAVTDMKAVKASRIPSVAGYVNWTRGREDRQYYSNGSQEAEKLAYTFSLTQPVFHWNAINLGIQSAKIRQQIDEGNTTLAKLALAQGVRSAYFAAILSEAGLERSRLDEKIRLARFEEITSRRQRNQASDADVFNSGLDKDAGILDRISNEENHRRAILALARLVGVSESTLNNLPKEIPLPNTDQIGAYAQGLIDQARSDIEGSSTAVANSELNLQVADNDLKVNRTTLRPKLNLVMGVTKDEQSLTADPSSRYTSDYYYAGLSMSWAIFDGFASRNRSKSLIARKRSAEVALNELKRDFLDGLTRISSELERNAFAVQLEERKYGSARNNLTFLQEQNKRGEASAAQVEAGELNELVARYSAYFVRATYWNSVVELISLTEVDPALDRIPSTNR